MASREAMREAIRMGLQECARLNAAVGDDARDVAAEMADNRGEGMVNG